MRVFVSIILFLFLSADADAAKKIFPAPTGYVNDLADVVDADSKAKITALAERLSKEGKAEIAVVTIRSMQEFGFANIEEAAVKLFEEWGIGKKGKDNGVLILASIKDRKLRIEVGYSLEEKIPDGRAGDIIRNGITPYFKAQRYGEGLYKGALLLSEAIEGAASPAIKKQSRGGQGFPIELFIIAFIILATLVSIIMQIMRGKGKAGRRRYRSSTFWDSGSGGFGGGGWASDSGGGFDGFGGGSSGGGGASGDW